MKYTSLIILFIAVWWRVFIFLIMIINYLFETYHYIY